MPINGVRFALDEDTKVQYVLEFSNNNLVGIGICPSSDTHEGMAEAQDIMQSGRFIAYDDDVMDGEDEDGNKVSSRPKYEVEFVVGPNGAPQITNIDISGVEPDFFPPQHGKADAAKARALTGRPKPSLTDNSNNPRSLKDVLGEAVRQGGNNGTGTRPNKPVVRDDIHKPGMVDNPKKSVADGSIENNLKKYGKDLVELAQQGRLDPVIGRDKETQDVMQLLLRKKRSNVMLLGEAGVGKTAIAQHLAQMIADGKAPAELADARIIELNLQDMNAGTQMRGEFEQRLMPILKGLDERGGYLKGQKVILFIDELHAALGAGSAMGAKGAGEMMKPYLSGGNFTAIGATTPEEFKKHIEKDKAMVRRFQPYTIDEPNTEHTTEIMQGVNETYSAYHAMDNEATDEQIAYVVRMTDRFMPNQQQPDKSIGILDDAAATARFDGRKEIEQRDILTAISKATGLKVDFLEQNDLERYLKLEENLTERVKGQPALKELAEALVSSRMGLTDDDAPRGVFLFAGPTGVGKTETAKGLNELLNGDAELVRINMGEFKEKHTVSKLIGSPPGYVGYEDNAGQLSEPVRNKPFTVVLLDEIEKAHPEVFDTLLSVFDDGELRDGQGRKVDFRNTIIVMTTNLGAKQVQAFLNGGGIGFSVDEDNENHDHDKVNEITMSALKKHLRPELINRIDGIYTFRHLDPSTVSDILSIRLRQVEKSLQSSPNGLQLENLSFEVSDNVKAALAEKGYDKAFGARPLKRAIQKHMTNDLGRWMMQNRDTLLEKNAKGPFKLVVEKLGDGFEPKLVQEEIKVQAVDTDPSTSNDDDTPSTDGADTKPPANDDKSDGEKPTQKIPLPKPKFPTA